MDIFSALNVGVTGIVAQGESINTISQNISNANTVGYKEGLTTFADLITDSSANNFSVNGNGSADAGYAPSGVMGSIAQLVNIEGPIDQTNSPTDLAISGPGFFAVSPTATNGTANLEYTQAGSFIPDKNGNYTNAAGAFLQAWPLDAQGNPPAGVAGPTINSAAAIAALQTVNIQKIIVQPVPTTTVSLQANLNSSQAPYTGSPVYNPANPAADMASGAVTPDFTIPITVVDSLGVNHTLEAGFLNGPTVLANGGAGPFSGITSGNNSITVTGPVPSGLAVGDVVSFDGSGPILDSNGATMLTAAQVNITHTVLSVGPGGYTVSSATAGGGVPAAGDIAFTANPSNGDTINLNGQTWTFVTSNPTNIPNETVIGANLGATLTQLASDLTASSNMALDNPLATYSSTGTALNIDYNTGDATSNNYTLGAPAVATQNLAGGGVFTPATGSLSFAANPANGQTIDLNGQTWTFVTGIPGANQTQIQGSLAATLTQLQTDLTTAAGGGNASLNVATYGASGTALNITYASNGAAGDAYTLSNIAPASSGATLAGGATTTNSGGISTAGIPGGAGIIDQITPNTWDVEIYANPPTDVAGANGQLATGLVTFNGDGSLASISPSLTQISVPWTAAGTTPSNIAFDWGTPGAIGVGLTNGLSQFAEANDVASIQQNGIQANTSTTTSISPDGVISVTYSGGGTRALYQIPLAQFVNPDGLNALSDNLYTPSQASGDVNFNLPSQGTASVLTPNALESSNVDIATQLTNMIVAQNAYQANTKLISTSDEMLQTLTQLDQSITI